MEELIKQSKEDFVSAINHFKEEISAIHVGRATPSLVENVKVQAYDNLSDLQHIASIAVPDPKTILIQPWDKGLLEPIQKALSEADLGMQPIAQDDRIMLSLPALTGERREEFKKVLSKKSEDARITIRSRRDKVKGDIGSAEKKKEISEDDKFRFQKKLQDEVDSAMGEIEKIEEGKQKELETV